MYVKDHRRRKLFNIGGGGGGGANSARPTSILWGVGYCQKYIYACVHMHMYAHACVEYAYTHACMHTHVCMHAQSMHTYILHPDMKIIKIKAMNLHSEAICIISVQAKQTRKILVRFFRAKG